MKAAAVILLGLLVATIVVCGWKATAIAVGVGAVVGAVGAVVTVAVLAVVNR